MSFFGHRRYRRCPNCVGRGARIDPEKEKAAEAALRQNLGDPGFLEVVDLSGEDSNQIFAEMARWEIVLKDTSLAKQPRPPSP